MIGLKNGTVQLFPHSNEWAKDAEQTSEKLKSLLGDKAVEIQHVGSTSIDGLKAKPIIDLAVGVWQFESILPMIPQLEVNGFIHIPENDDETQLFFSCGDFEKGIRTHHIHVVFYEGKEWNDYLMFRDTLRSNPDKRNQYEQLKQQLMQQFSNDRENYTDSKSSFIQSVLRL